jgi:hypothetical protein
LALYRVAPPLRLASRLEGVYRDGWMGADAAYTRYAPTRGDERVRISRRTWHEPSPPARVTIRVVPLVGGQPAAGAAAASATWTVRTGLSRTFTLKTPRVPYRVDIHVAPTFSPSDYGEADTRQLGAEVGF